MKPAVVLWAIGVAILFPLFFQLSGGIYNSYEVVTDSGGVLAKLPLPISILACLGGIFILKNNYRSASLAVKVAGAMLLVMLVSLILAGENFYVDKRKVIMLAQILLPVAGLVLGQMVNDEGKIVPRAFLYVLILIVPAQLAAGWIQGHFALTHYLYAFSIYQHFQYVPLIFVCAFIFAITALWDSHRKVFYFLVPLMAIYAVASMSLLTGFAFLAFMISFGMSQLRNREGRTEALAVTGLAMLFVALSFVVLKNVNESPGASYEPQYHGKMEMLESGEVPQNLSERFADWKLFGGGIIESGRTALVGHPAPIPREVRSSAHNWYLDIAYSFGLISWLPVLFLLGYTVKLLWRNRSSLPPEILWLAIIVLYLVVIDSNFKVTLRQPYPGIFTYFLWGMLLTALLGKRGERGNG